MNNFLIQLWQTSPKDKPIFLLVVILCRPILITDSTKPYTPFLVSFAWLQTKSINILGLNTFEQTKNFRKSSKINLRWTNRTGMRMHTHPSCCLLLNTHKHLPVTRFLFRPSFILKSWDTDGVVGALQR